MTKRQAIRHHRRMWNWIANESEKTGIFKGKQDYFNKFGGNIRHNCYLCHYAYQKPFSKSMCENCPLYWKSNCKEHMCCDLNYPDDRVGLYRQFEDFEGTLSNYVRLARKIASLPKK